MIVVDKHLYAKNKEMLKMFRNINVEKRTESNFSKLSKSNHTAVKKALVKSKYKNISNKRK